MNDPVTMRFRCEEMASASEPAGRNSPKMCWLSSSMTSTIEPVNSTLYSTPDAARYASRGPTCAAPTFCAAMAEMPMPTANAGIWM